MVRRLAEATFDYVKFTFGAMFVVAFLFALISLSDRHPTVVAAFVIGAVGTKVIASLLLWAFSKTGKMKDATIESVFVAVALEVVVFFLPMALLDDIRAKVLHKG